MVDDTDEEWPDSIAERAVEEIQSSAEEFASNAKSLIKGAIKNAVDAAIMQSWVHLVPIDDETCPFPSTYAIEVTFEAVGGCLDKRLSLTELIEGKFVQEKEGGRDHHERQLMGFVAELERGLAHAKAYLDRERAMAEEAGETFGDE